VVPIESSRTVSSVEAFPLELVDTDDIASDPWRPGTLVLRGLKRAFDLMVATLLLVVLLPMLVVLAIMIRMESPGKVIFAHRRLGRDGRHFDCLKFRSMRPDAEHLLLHDDSLRHHYVTNHFKIPAHLDPRVTRLGRFLRKSSIDELPQLWNVLTGDMSLVGPRPIVALEANYYGDELPVLLAMRPGITGSWAVHGRSEVGYPDRVKLELDYVRNWSVLGDLQILVRTPLTVFTQRGAV
jgi:exopolysaccharide production protein ExoY